MATKTLPTDKNGQLYYGPKTFRQADELVQQAMESEHLESSVMPRDIAARVADNMESGGYIIAASRLRREYGV